METVTYRMGVDLGTTYSSAAVARDGRVEMVPLGNRSAVIPSVVYVRPDGSFLAGEAAVSRLVTAPDRVAREFKRRVGDPTPIDLAGERVSAEALMAAMLPPIIEAVAAREGGPADRLALTHPANWSQAKVDGVVSALDRAALPEVMTVSEPEAAAIYYAANERIEDGQVVAVYDLGGGTFDTALLRRAGEGFELIGRPEGIDRLGGVDFDAALFSYVDRFLDGAVGRADASDPATHAALAQLRNDCVAAKEALSADTDVEIPVLLPSLRTEVRVTRGEFEDMIRPALSDSIGALRRAMRSAQVAPADVGVVLLVGGSSRIPLVAQLVGAELGRPVAIDAHPKHAIALGAAIAADLGPEALRPAATASAAVADPAPAADAGPPAAESGQLDAPAPAEAVERPEEVDGPAATSAARADSSAVLTEARLEPAATDGSGRRTGLVVGAAVALVAALVAGFVLFGGGGDQTTATEATAPASGAAAGPASTAPPASAEAVTTTATGAEDTQASTDGATTVAPTTGATTTVPPTAGAADAPGAGCDSDAARSVCMLSVSVDASGNLIIPFETKGFEPNIVGAANRHIHFFFPVGAMAEDPINAGSSGSGGSWLLWDAPNPHGPGGATAPYTLADAQAVGATSICALVANSRHEVTIGTGNCLALPA